jgi:hypothetical protein
MNDEYSFSCHSFCAVLKNTPVRGSGRTISLGSRTIDEATYAGVRINIDGDIRPIGLLPNVGADEIRRRMFSPLASKSVGQGEPRPTPDQPSIRRVLKPDTPFGSRFALLASLRQIVDNW